MSGSADREIADMRAERADVMIVGAGLAGLRAACDLVSNGLSVIVIEARDRVGGRVFSHRFDDGQWCERGAEFIDSTHTEVLELAVGLSLGLTPVPSQRDDSARLVDVGGRTNPLAWFPSVVAERDAWHAALAEHAVSVNPDAPVESPAARRLDARSAGALLAGMGLSAMARLVIGRDLRTEFMVPPDEISLLHAAWMTRRAADAGDGREAFRVNGGNDQLATGLAERLADSPGARLWLGSVVAAIDAVEGLVTLNDGRQVHGGAVVLAVPPPVAGRIQITPPLPVAATAISMGVGAKVSVQSSRRAWRDEGFDGSVVSDRAYGQLWETTDGQAGDRGVLTALLSSRDGAALGVLPDLDDRIRREIRRIFPATTGLLGESITTDWTNDPWSLGCYAAFAPGELTASWDVLQRPHGRIHLAGEHTDGFAGFMEGALRSGRRAAAAILSA